ncbi:MFS transporter [Catenovulum adriaticum]|uniref:MFS transporter n=1 Tax=Catenovulum adriaticum TaxID=2984846 RepID=A0ABY7ATG5_9ALTE|nr:MFS transporter [Catenovulum sp. TS8]WAJ71815.1 MFS transporter [Catenovulum sp. TS8]
MLQLPAIKNKEKVAIGSGYLAIFFAGHSINALTTPYYQMTRALDPLLLAIALTLPLIISAAISSQVAIISDKIKFKWGSRRQLILLSGWVAGISFSSLWIFPESWGDTTLLMMLCLVASVFYISSCFFSINIKCVTFETRSDNYQRTLVLAFASVFERIGSLVYFWLYPLAKLPIWQSVYTGVQVVGSAVGLLLIAGFATIFAFLCQEKTDKTPHFQQLKQAKLTFSNLTPDIKKALTIILALVILKFGATSVCSSFDYYLLVYYVNYGDIEAGSHWKGILSTSFALFGILLTPVIAYLVNAYGKISILKFIYVISSVAGAAKWFIYTPESEWLIILDALLNASSWVAMSVIIPALLADLSAIHHKASGYQNTSYFVSQHNKVLQFSLVIALIGSGTLLNLIGFDASSGTAQTESSLFFMRLILSVGSILFSLLPIWLLTFYPSNCVNHSQLTGNLNK